MVIGKNAANACRVSAKGIDSGVHWWLNQFNCQYDIRYGYLFMVMALNSKIKVTVWWNAATSPGAKAISDPIETHSDAPFNVYLPLYSLSEFFEILIPNVRGFEDL